MSAYFGEQVKRSNFLESFKVLRQHDDIIQEKTQCEDIQREILNNILPPFIVAELKQQPGMVNSSSSFKQVKSLSNNHDAVSILFADIVGFTSFARELDPSTVMQYLNQVRQRM